MPQQHDSFQYMPRQSHPESTDFYEFKNRAVNYRESTRIIQSRFDIDQDYAIFSIHFFAPPEISNYLIPRHWYIIYSTFYRSHPMMLRRLFIKILSPVPT